MRLVCLVFVILSKVAFGQSYTGDSWSKVSERKKGTILLAYVDTPCFSYDDGYGRLAGICADIMNDFVMYVNRTRNVELDMKMVGKGSDFFDMYNKVRTSEGGVFGLGNITMTEERKKEVKFSPPYITNFAILITQSSVPMLTRFEDLPKTFTNLTAYTAKGTLNDQRITELKQKYFPKMVISYTENSLETLDKVTADPNSFAYLDLAFYLKAVQDGKSVKRHSVGDKPAEQFAFIMPLTSDWGPLMEEFFNADGGYTNTPEYKEILRLHLGETGLKLLQSAPR